MRFEKGRGSLGLDGRSCAVPKLEWVYIVKPAVYVAL